MSRPLLNLTHTLEAWASYRGGYATIHCPTCGDRHGWILPSGAAMPFRLPAVDCPSCGDRLEVTAVAWESPPEQPHVLAPLSGQADVVAQLERLRCAASPVAPPAPPPPRPARPPSIERRNYSPCPPTAERRRFVAWQRAGLIPADVEPSSVAAAFRRMFGGAEPRRDPQKQQIRCYSHREVRGCLWLLRREGRGVGQ